MQSGHQKRLLNKAPIKALNKAPEMTCDFLDLKYACAEQLVPKIRNL